MSINWDRPAIATSGISVLLLLHNDASRLRPSVDAWLTFLRQREQEFELLLIDDGSSDRTGEIAQTLAEQSEQVRLYSHSHSQGIGAALRTGLAEARLPLLFYTTCAPIYQPKHLEMLLREIDQVDLVVGGRAAPTPSTAWKLFAGVGRWAMWLLFGVTLEPYRVWPGWKGWAYYWCNRWVFGVRIVDLTSACKLFRRSLFERIPIQAVGPFVHTEILAKANFLGCTMAELPIGTGNDDRLLASAPLVWHEHVADWWHILHHADFGPPAISPRAIQDAAPSVDS